jgi:hypothetical protein
MDTEKAVRVEIVLTGKIDRVVLYLLSFLLVMFGL